MIGVGQVIAQQKDLPELAAAISAKDGFLTRQIALGRGQLESANILPFGNGLRPLILLHQSIRQLLSVSVALFLPLVHRIFRLTAVAT